MGKEEIIRGSKLRVLINSYLFKHGGKVSKQDLRTALDPKIKDLFAGIEPEKVEKSFTNLVDNMARANQIIKHADGHQIEFSSIEHNGKKEPVSPEETSNNRRIGQQIRSIKNRLSRNEEVSNEERKFLADYEAGRQVVPLGEPTKPHKARKTGTEVATRSVPVPTPVPHNHGHHPDAGMFNSASPSGIDVQMFTTNGSVIRMTAHSDAQIDALLGAIKKHQF